MREGLNGWERMIADQAAEIERLKGDGVLGELRAENERLRTILRTVADWLWHGLQSHRNMETYLREQAGPPPSDDDPLAAEKRRQVEVALIFRGRSPALPIEDGDSF